ncbi:cytochrome P450 [Methylobacterium planeticum]|uniref:Cytochrome P450 n=1 Tax=Methylobacterium planeticum TaxID=2615211 RepID=A0A6N6MNM3_9HYPH|nr:cytochrome P450 [Methylobacterium planeticum]KAB1070950.1 cytochrome P450 [Methylobacterium planeticum]
MDSSEARLRDPLLRAPRLVPPLREPPDRDPPLLAYLAALRTNGIGGWSRRAYAEPVVRRRILGRHSFTLSDPDAVRHVLIDNEANYARTSASVRILRPVLGDGLLISEGQNWRRQRRALAPAFTPKAVEELVPHIAAAVDAALMDLEPAAARGPVDLFPALHGLALEIAGRTMFSVGMARHGPALRDLVTEYGDRLARPHLLDMLLPLGLPAPLDFARARFRRRWLPFLDGIIAARDAEPAAGRETRDLLDLLAAARDPETGEGFPQAQLRDQVATMIMAGHETTAVALLWASYLLALAPEIQEQVAEEAAGADLDRGVALEERLPITRAVVDETLRLYPPAFVIVRAARAADRVGGHAVAKGDVVVISPWVLHRHRRLWVDPDAFDPSRFLTGAPAVPRFAYLPFGAGPRVCIGAHFALTEATLALARLVARFRISLPAGTAILPAAVVTTQPDHAPAFTLHRRRP